MRYNDRVLWPAWTDYNYNGKVKELAVAYITGGGTEYEFVRDNKLQGGEISIARLLTKHRNINITRLERFQCNK